MARNGLPVAGVLAAATVEPGRAMRREAELGTLEVGKRADLVLLARDPLASIANLEAIDGVMVRGIWLPRSALDAMLAAIEAIDRGPAHPRTRGDLDRALDTLEQLRARGYVLRDHFLGWLRFRLEAAHLPVDRPLFAGIAALDPDE
jgi:alpha-D-ribose 1-methylphosphonate 5-triphosphate diphosphatase PhnM